MVASGPFRSFAALQHHGSEGVDRTYRGHHKIDAHYPFETSSKSDPAGLLSGSMLC
jgi:hypothetical protein